MYQSKLSAPALALMLAPALGCPGGSTTGDEKDAAVDTQDMATMSTADMAVQPAFCSGGNLTKANDAKFIGSWAIQSKVTQAQDVPGYGKQESTVTTLSFADFKLDANNQLVMEQRDCRITSTGVQATGTTVTIADTVPQTTPSSTQPIKVCDTAGNITWQREQATVLVGCKLTDPIKDPLPTAATDAAVFDQDNDKKAGVTIQIGGPFKGDLYTVQRQRFSYTSAALPSGGAASGATIDRSEQNTLDASNPLLKTKVPLTPVDAKSSFRLASITGITTCTELINKSGTLFP
ncbi:MAG TPA: hypothetical protein PKI03_01350 [Pseudomonadota bacterium]|nr:hypothetical protein [Pseudomonadota bacterium]